MKLFYLLGLLFFPFMAVGQPCKVSCSRANLCNVSPDSLEKSYPGIIKLSDSSRTSFIVALSYFPQLSNFRIKLKSAKIRTTLNVRPSIGSLLFNRKNNRIYIVRINNSLKDSVITLDEIPSDARVGIFGHELSHIVDYKNKNVLGVLGRAFAYLSKSKKGKYEREIDSLVIKHGLGCPLFQWSTFVLNASDASYKYKTFKRRIYMRPEEIENYNNDQVKADE